MPVINNDKTLLIRCTCHGHVLEIAYDDDWVKEDIEPYFYVSVWNQTPFPFSFSQRLKLIWSLLRGKSLSGDDVVIKKSDAKSIVNFLNKKLLLLEKETNHVK